MLNKKNWPYEQVRCPTFCGMEWAIVIPQKIEYEAGESQYACER